MTYPITPNPSIHQQPKNIGGQNMVFTGGQLQQWAQQLPLAMTLQLMDAILKALGVSQSDIDALNKDATAYYNQVQTTLGSFQTAWSALQTDFNTSNQAFATLLSSWYTTLTTGGQSWSSVLSSLDSAWNTYITTDQQVNAAVSTTISQILSNIFGFDPTTGLINSTNIAGLEAGFNELGAALTGDTADAGSWEWLASFMNNVYTTLGLTHTTTVDNNNTLAIRDNRPISYGLDNTTESNIAFTAATDILNVSSAGSVWGFVRCAQTDTKNTIAFTASTSAAPTSFVVSLYKVDFTNSVMDYINTSSNFVSQLTSSEKWLFTTAGATAVAPGDVLAVEFEVTGSGSVNVYGQSLSGKPTHPVAMLPGAAATRSGTITHANTAFSALTFNNTSIPYIGLETSSPPPPVYPDFTSTFGTPGTYTQTLDSWAVHVDLIGVGAGGGGEGETGAGNGDGGTAGSWNNTTLTVGGTGPTGIKAGSPITITVGTGGARGPYFTPGGNGTATTFSWVDASNAAQSLTCSPGAGGQPSTNLTSWGIGPGNHTYNGVTYPGGGTNAVGGTGYYPGGGGTGGAAFQWGFAGASGEAWTVERQS